MLVDVSVTAPLRDSAQEMRAKRRRQDREKAQKVLPRQGSEEPLNQDEDHRPKGNALNAYV